MAEMTTGDEARGEVTSRPDDGDVFKIVLDKVKAANNALIAEGVLPSGLDQSRVVVEPPRLRTSPTESHFSSMNWPVSSIPSGPEDLIRLIYASLCRMIPV